MWFLAFANFGVGTWNIISFDTIFNYSAGTFNILVGCFVLFGVWVIFGGGNNEE